jgi:hypothetical protein
MKTNPKKVLQEQPPHCHKKCEIIVKNQNGTKYILFNCNTHSDYLWNSELYFLYNMCNKF